MASRTSSALGEHRIGDTLAILGGEPVLANTLPRRRSIGRPELDAVRRVVESGCLSGFYGSCGPEFDGGPAVKTFEAAWRERFGAAHAVSVNSATSGLVAAMGAIGIGPGDEVIVPPLTMSATVVAPLFYGGVPVFVDVDPETFCLDPALVRRAITERTKAILVVNLFGHPAELAELRALADEVGIRLIEDNAQAPLAAEDGRPAGTVGHIGVFSLNYHKHLHTGEGGMCVTDDDELALRLRLIRNHGENVVEPLGLEDLTDLLGFNFRMTELSAAVGLAQLERIDDLVGQIERVGRALTEGIAGLVGLAPPLVRAGCRHVYYVWAMRYDEKVLGPARSRFSEALAAEGFPNATGYVQPLYMLPLLRNRGAPYVKGLCPVAERLHEQELLCFEPCLYDIDEDRTELLVKAVRKVHAHRRELAEATREPAHAAHHCEH